MKITVLGSGTSQGIPVIGCQCAACVSRDPRDTRRRASIAIQANGSTIIVDTSPDFRMQVLDAGLMHLDAVLYTHPHADHLHGLDDIRGFNHVQHHPIPCYGDARTLAILRESFRYIFEAPNFGGGLPEITLNEITGPFETAGIAFEPLRVMHGPIPILGYRFGKAAYITDASSIPEETISRLHGLDVLILNALRHEPHPTHLSVAESVAVVERVRPKATYFTHICHRLVHEKDEAALPAGVRFAYDGLVLEVPGET